MNNDNLTKGVFAALLLVSTVASAEDKYPASDFQPKVVYQDEAVAKSAEASGSTTKSASTASSSDSQFPAADFEPKVVFSDPDYKHTASSPNPNAGSSSSSSMSDTTPSGAADSSAAVATKDESSMGYILGLVVLAAAGFVLFKRGAGAKTPTAKSNAPRNQGGLTGVAKYVSRISGTGVSRYLEKNSKIALSAAASAKSSATGVDKYLASQDSSVSATSNKGATGVEKYMRKKG
ncbi:MAG: hypothetical protein ABL933_05135 [Methyloglobulus sp.]